MLMHAAFTFSAPKLHFPSTAANANYDRQKNPSRLPHLTTRTRNGFVALRRRSLRVVVSSESSNYSELDVGLGPGPGPRGNYENMQLKDEGHFTPEGSERSRVIRSFAEESGGENSGEDVGAQALSLGNDGAGDRGLIEVGRNYERLSPSEEEGERGGDSQAEDFRTLVSAMGLIMGTAVGPGILGLPAATLPAGVQASTMMIIGAWAYVTSSILLVAEISCAVMAELGEEEVSFTGLVEHTLGFNGARAVALVYASLNYALLVACVAGLGSILHGWVPIMPAGLWSAASAAIVGASVAFAPFKILDGFNRALCGLMLTAITCLVAIGVDAVKSLPVNSGATPIISFGSVLSAVPVTVLTLGFHVITPVVCKLMKGKPQEARKAILLGGAVPLAMVLAWNGVILSLAPNTSSAIDPIKLLLSLNRSAAPAVQAFAFAALGTTLIGYAVSFPKQLADTSRIFSQGAQQEVESRKEDGETVFSETQPLFWALCPPTLAAVLWPTAFASALDFAGVYANCFLFGILPPVMAWIFRYHLTKEVPVSSRLDKPLVPGGMLLLILLFGISILLGIRPRM